MLTERPGRAKIVFAHHSRLSRGKHGDNKTVAALWECLFDDGGAPLAALTVGGHDHNVTWYEPRPMVDPHKAIVPLERGIFVHVNGAGGHGHDETTGVFTGFFQPISGTTPQFADDDHWCVTRIAVERTVRAIDGTYPVAYGTSVTVLVTRGTEAWEFVRWGVEGRMADDLRRGDHAGRR